METLHKELAAITPNLASLPWLWLSATDQEQEGVWLDYYTGDRIGDFPKPWYPGHDARYDNTYNCLRYYTDTPADIAWGESHCLSISFDCPCQYSRQPIMYLRGGCPHNEFDKMYTTKQLAT